MYKIRRGMPLTDITNVAGERELPRSRKAVRPALLRVTAGRVPHVCRDRPKRVRPDHGTRTTPRLQRSTKLSSSDTFSTMG